MIPPDIRAEILRRISKAETEHNVRVLLAVESGSRAWGFESPNSDYDVRFIYAHTRDWYLSFDLEEQRDVIEYPIVDDIDLNGWDIRKALKLFSKSNPAFVEWILSPLIYSETGAFAASARQMLPAVYSCASGTHHYRSMARTNYRSYPKADRLPIKKYFYVLRPLLAVRWLERYGSAAPVEFGKMLALIEDDRPLLADIAVLLKQKRATPEMGLAPQVPSIHAFIENELTRIESLAPPIAQQSAISPALNDIFRRCLIEAWQ